MRLSGGAAWYSNANGQVDELAVIGSYDLRLWHVHQHRRSATQGIAALDAASGAATAWNPNSNSYVYALAVSGARSTRAAPSPLLAGSHACTSPRSTPRVAPPRPGTRTPTTTSTLGGEWGYGLRRWMVHQHRRAPSQSCRRAGCGSGAVTTWNLNLSGDGSGVAVRSLAVSGGTVSAGGSFNWIAAQPRNNIAALDATSGAATAWNPNANGVVRALAVSGGTVYAGRRLHQHRRADAQLTSPRWMPRAVPPPPGTRTRTGWFTP